jgi:NADPH:quinone reductase-like Zn-dependent oxidoreductase
VIEIGGADTISQSFQAVRVGGHISLVGILAGAAGNVPLYQMLGRQIRVQGVGVGSRRHQCELIAALNAAKIRPVIDKRVFPMTELADAFRYLISGQHFGKICVTV